MIGQTMPAQIDCDDAMPVGELDELLFPLPGEAAKTVQEQERPLASRTPGIDHAQLNERIV